LLKIIIILEFLFECCLYLQKNSKIRESDKLDRKEKLKLQPTHLKCFVSHQEKEKETSSLNSSAPSRDSPKFYSFFCFLTPPPPHWLWFPIHLQHSTSSSSPSSRREPRTIQTCHQQWSICLFFRVNSSLPHQMIHSAAHDFL